MTRGNRPRARAWRRPRTRGFNKGFKTVLAAHASEKSFINQFIILWISRVAYLLWGTNLPAIWSGFRPQ